MSGQERAHYDRLAGSYDENWAYSPDFIAWMTGQILDRLEISPGERVLDLGCGTGLYSRGLADLAGQVLCADPSRKMLDQLPAGPEYVPIQATAEDIVSGRVRLPHERLDAILVKESIHHVEDPPAVVAGLAKLLAPGGRLLVVMLPTTIAYPLFTAALELFERLQPDPEVIAALMRDSRLEAEVAYEEFELSFEKQRYLKMVRARYMSLLSHFSDTELAAGVSEIDEQYPGDRLNFPDRLAFVLGVRR